MKQSTTNHKRYIWYLFYNSHADQYYYTCLLHILLAHYLKVDFGRHFAQNLYIEWPSELKLWMQIDYAVISLSFENLL